MELGFLFPGQGAQQVGMLADVAAAAPSVAERFQQASDALGFDLGRIVNEGPAPELNRTAITQPALLTASAALYDVWRERGGPAPTMVAGHSLGEYSALLVAGVLDFAAAVRLVHERGKLMQAAVPSGEGAMAAVLGLDDDVIARCCEEVPGTVAPANYNSPGQVVVAGAAAAVAAVVAACRAAGARRTVALDVSVPSHCVLMASAGERLGEMLDDLELRPPNMPIYQNATGQAATSPSVIRDNLLTQLVSPVRWSDCVSAMAEAGAETFVECGPGNVLAGLARRIDRSLDVHGIGTLDGLEAAVQAVRTAA